MHKRFFSAVILLLLFENTGAQTTLNFDYVSRILIRIKGVANNSDTLNLILDSGFEGSVLDKSTAQRTKLKFDSSQSEKVPGGEIEVSHAYDVTFKLGDIRFLSKKIEVIPLDGLSAVVGEKIDGVLGHDFFLSHVFALNYEKKQIEFFDPHAFHYEGKGTVVPVWFEDNQPFLNAVLYVNGNPKKAKLKIDTGSGDVLGLNGSYVFKENLFPANYPRLNVLGAALGGKTKNYLTRIEQIQIENLNLLKPYIGYSEDTMRKGDAGTLGNELLSRFKVFFNYADRQLILEKNSSFAAPFTFDFSGLFILANASNFREFTILDAIPGSPAAKAGLKYGDKILSINGQNSNRYSLSQIKSFFLREGVSIQMVIERNGEKLGKKFVTKNYF